MLHTKMKGFVGHLAIAMQLIGLGYSVFTELGDNSRVDLIVLVNNKPIKIQVKAITPVNGAVQLKPTKSGPNYKFKYTLEDIDLFAVYVLDGTDRTFFVTANELLEKSSVMIFRITKPKNNQIVGVHYIESYSNFNEILAHHKFINS